MTLNVSNMGLIGHVPPGLGNLSFLRTLNLQGKNFIGILPDYQKAIGGLLEADRAIFYWRGDPGAIDRAGGDFLRQFRSGNSLSGRIPPEFRKLKKLVELDLQSNQHSGPIPSAIFNISTLESIAFTYNQLTGNLPADLCSYLPRIEEFWLGGNQFSGGIPSNLHECSWLQILTLEFNNLNNFSGSLQELQLLSLQHNQIRGQIPVSICEIPSLAFLSADTNRIAGEIPQCLGTMTSLSELNLSNNLLESDIPSSSWSLRDLLVLYISSNNLSGSFPSNIGNLEALTFMDLSEIFSEICCLFEGLQKLAKSNAKKTVLKDPFQNL
ncbi:hypothetical protein Leryth_024289 [Lithospermum erythrorhizon]|nr:hypothetical protein Leryth_024289 [Lithospermum erythrorhizon]